MGAIIIRKLDDKIKARLKIRAAHHGRSMEEEAREILRSALGNEPNLKDNLADIVRRRFAPLRGIELELPSRDPIREPPDFSE
jgi:plasmid stability protein